MFSLSVRITWKTCVFLTIADTETYEISSFEDRPGLVVQIVELEYFLLYFSLIIFFLLCSFLVPFLPPSFSLKKNEELIIALQERDKRAEMLQV